jgi:hypothetical protein
VKGHNERRFSVKWDAPAPRMREVVQALRADLELLAERDHAATSRGSSTASIS